MKDDEYELLQTKKRNNNVTYENDIYLTVDDDFEDFDRGVNILQELTENGIISEEEEKRRRELLRKYLDYQHALEYSTKVSTVSKKITFRWQNCLSCAHKAFEHCMGYVYYTDTD
mmetsp:Transcript_8685/g.8621  ORF Transcript_8685/g.8621 Transcript_8685/m.8621 type:complete len:115 (+) Transcript_8685:189-533(+)